MIKDAESNGLRGLKARTVRQFPSYFRGDYSANTVRALQYWKEHHVIMQRHCPNARNSNLVISSTTRGSIKRALVKARRGRGRKRSERVSIFFVQLLSEFERLRAVGVRFNAPLLRQLAIDTIQRSAHPECNNGTIDVYTELNRKMHITPMWVTRFMACNNIVSRTQSGRLVMSAAKWDIIHRKVAYLLGIMCRDFRAGRIHETGICNGDETNVVTHLRSNNTVAPPPEVAFG